MALTGDSVIMKYTMRNYANYTKMSCPTRRIADNDRASKQKTSDVNKGNWLQQLHGFSIKYQMAQVRMAISFKTNLAKPRLYGYLGP